MCSGVPYAATTSLCDSIGRQHTLGLRAHTGVRLGFEPGAYGSQHSLGRLAAMGGRPVRRRIGSTDSRKSFNAEPNLATRIQLAMRDQSQARIPMRATRTPGSEMAWMRSYNTRPRTRTWSRRSSRSMQSRCGFACASSSATSTSEERSRFRMLNFGPALRIRRCARPLSAGGERGP